MMALLRRNKSIWNLQKKQNGGGVIHFRIDRIASDYTTDYYKSNLPKNVIRLYTQNGIKPSRGIMCEINQQNVSEFLSEYDFYNSKNYKGIAFFDWFDNKLNTYFLLSPFKEYLPKHFLYIEYLGTRQILYKLDDKIQVNGEPYCIIKGLLKDYDLALKRCRGGHGDGFIKLSLRDEVCYKNDTAISEDDLKKTINQLDGYIVTQFVKPQQGLRDICGENSFAVMRVITLFSQEKQKSEVAAIIIRLGTAKSGPTQAKHDHIYAGVNMIDGKLFNPIYEVNDYSYFRTNIHPETKKIIEGYKITNLDLLKSVVCQIADYVPITPYLVFDIIPTENSFAILEINSHGQPFIVEPFYRIKNNPIFREIFEIVD